MLNRLGWSKLDRTIIFLLLGICFLLWGGILIKGGQLNKIAQRDRVVVNQIDRLKKENATNQASIDDVANRKALHSSNKGIRLSMQQILETDKAVQLTTNVFKVLEDFNDHKSYVNRKKLVKPYVTKDFLASDQIFAKDDDGTGHSYIDGSGLENSFVDAQVSAAPIDDQGNLPLLVKVSFDSRDNTGSGNRQSVYATTYNIHNKKLSHIELLNNLSSSSQN